ncbi:MAG: hypothetical protein LWX83_07565, partial [Anaerolineae bacterium]|nr:hypothetical protein [Anaerolineae bacterium]
ILAVIVINLTGCNLPGMTTPTVEPSTAPTLPPSPTALPLPTATPTPPPNHVILVTPPNTPNWLIQNVQPVLAELAGKDGLALDVVESLKPEDINSSTKMVFLTGLPEYLPQLVAAAPQTQFAAISPLEIQTVPNFNLIRLQPERQAFIAGTVVITVAGDWRALGLLPTDESSAGTLQDAFRNGAQYFCGICNSYYAPIVRFPIVRQTDSLNYQAVVDEAHKNIVYAIYVSPEIATPDMLRALASQQYILVGGDTPPDDVKSRWAATVRQNPAESIRTLWPGMLSGQGGQVVPASVSVEDANPQFFSVGKQNLVQSVIKELDAGQIAPLTPALQ